MKEKRGFVYLVIFIFISMLSLTGCGGDGDERIAAPPPGGEPPPGETPPVSGPAVSVSGSVDSSLLKSIKASIRKSAASVGTIEVYDVSAGKKLTLKSGGEINTQGAFNPAFDLPNAQSTIVFKATIGSNIYRAVTSIDLSGPTITVGVNNMVVKIDTASNTVAEALKNSLGLAGAIGEAATNKTFSEIKNALAGIKDGKNYIYAYVGSGISITGEVGIELPRATTFTVKDKAGVVDGATVYAIPSSDVAAIASAPLTTSGGNYTEASLKADEPLEDLINGNYTPAGSGVTTYAKGVTDSTGKATLSLKPGNYFIYVAPAGTDTRHLPGGGLSRLATQASELWDRTTEIKISSRPPGDATYIGSTICMTCHPAYANVKQTMHKLGIRTPGMNGNLQDSSKFQSTTDPTQNINTGLVEFEANGGAGTTIYFYDYDGTRGFDKFKTSGTQPTSGTLYAKITVFKDTDGKYRMRFENVFNPADPKNGMVKEVVLTYGGGVYKQRYLAKSGNSIYVLPLQFNSAGSESYSVRTRKVWRDYHLKKWITATESADKKSLTAMTFKDASSASDSFDVNCASCHFNGYSVTKNAAGEYVATGVSDILGEVHPITGVKQEMNIGCETCHGPGSQHREAIGSIDTGRYIVNPNLLTPERESMICGQCHSRPLGNDEWGLKNEQPLNKSNRMMIAGTSRAEFLSDYTSRHDASETSDLWPDRIHSKSHHQQYTDFIKSKKYRNATRLLTCASCHDLHAPGTDRHQLSGTSDNSLCGECHTSQKSDIDAHMINRTGSRMISSAMKCIQCHNVKTTPTGAGRLGMAWGSDQYYENDITSHVFDVPDLGNAGVKGIAAADAMPIAYTNSCAVCHTTSPTLIKSIARRY